MGISRIEKEKKIVKLMISLYCRRKEGNSQLCKDCQSLLDYAQQRLDCCPFKEHKASCKNCHIHCYRSDFREQMRRVMRFSGPRMLLYHPIIALKHLVYNIAKKRGTIYNSADLQKE